MLHIPDTHTTGGWYRIFLSLANWTKISFQSVDKIETIYAVHGIIFELLAEPLYILSQNLLLLRLRLVTESVATQLRCLTTYFLIVEKHDMVIFVDLQKECFYFFLETWTIINSETSRLFGNC
jgi:Rft protein